MSSAIMNLEMADNWKVFPGEIWETIINNVEDSKDVCSILWAFPSLDLSTSLQKCKRYWLVGEVITLLVNKEQLNESDVLNCRLVCWDWCHRIDYLLSNQSTLKAYHPQELQKKNDPSSSLGYFWNPRNYLGRWLTRGGRRTRRNGTIRKKKNYLGGVKFHSNEADVVKFNNTITNNTFLPKDRNPFLSRSLSITIVDGYVNPIFWQNIFTILERFGGYIWFLKLEVLKNPGFWHFLQRIDYQELLQTLQRILHYLPNLKSVSFESQLRFRERDVMGFVPADNQFPALTSLQTLKFDPIQFPMGSSAKFLLSRLDICDQIRRLELPFSIWTKHGSNLLTFTSLTELRFTRILNSSQATARQITSSLLDLNAPNLAKLQFQFELLYPITFDLKGDLNPWLRKFPHLKYLDLSEDCTSVLLVNKSGELPSTLAQFPSLEFFSFRDPISFSYDFLASFISLRHLQITVRPEPKVVDFSSSCRINILEEIQTATLYKSNIWKVLPKLKTVTLLEEFISGSRNINRVFSFDRATYEQLNRSHSPKTAPSTTSFEPEYANLRPDILYFLNFPPYDNNSSVHLNVRPLADGIGVEYIYERRQSQQQQLFNNEF